MKEMIISILIPMGPILIGQISLLLMEVISMIFVGHLEGAAKVAGVGLGNVYVNILA